MNHIKNTYQIETSSYNFEKNECINNNPQTLIRTCHRESPTLQRTIDSIKSVGFKEPIIFEDLERKGPFWSFCESSKLLIEKYEGWVLICEDDVIFCKSSFNILNTIAINKNQTLSLWCSAEQDMTLSSWGWNKSVGNFHGSLAYFVHTESLNKIINSSTFKYWKGRDRVDKNYCFACKEKGIEFFVHRPSLVQHIGEVSTLRPSTKLNYRRESSNFNLLY
jgi:hypothetical protein